MPELTHEKAVRLNGLLARTKAERGKARKERDAAEARVRDLEKALATVVLQTCNGSTAPESVLRTMLANAAQTARDALKVIPDENERHG